MKTKVGYSIKELQEKNGNNTDPISMQLNNTLSLLKYEFDQNKLKDDES